MKAWLLTVLIGVVSAQAFGQVDMRHMRGVHATSNYGVNVQGFRRAIFGAPSSISADSVSVNVSRSTSAAGTWDLAAISLTGVTIGTAPKLASAGFWLSRNANTGELSLAFNRSMDQALAPVTGFSGDVNLPRSADGQRIDLSQMSRTSGTARDYVIAVALQGSTLVSSSASFQVSGGAALDRSTLMASLDAVRTSIQQQESAKARYFEFLKSVNAEWIAITVPIYTDSIADPTVRVKYRPAGDVSGEPYTFDDADLQDFVVQAKQNGFKVTMAFEFYPVIMDVNPGSPGCGTPQYKPNRWLLGQPTVNPQRADQACINPADWWWNPAHALYAANVATFWNSFQQIAVKYATLAQQTGVDIFILGTEQDNLFRTRAGAAPYTNHFRNELTALVSAVRAQYSGPVTFEQLWTAFAHPEYFGNGGGTSGVFDSVFADLNLDLVAVSAYFNLTNSIPNRVLSVQELEAAWEGVFTRYLLPLQARNPGKPIIFSEWGYTNDITSPYVQGANLSAAIPSGTAGSDGMAQQKNIIQAFFNVNARYNDLVRGSFLWGVGFQDPGDCQKVSFGVYCKPSTQTLADAYAAWLKTDVNRVLDWAQVVYPQYLPGTATTNAALGYLYRYYSATGTYVGVRDGRAYLHNGSQWNFWDVGAFRDYLDAAGRAGY